MAAGQLSTFVRRLRSIVVRQNPEGQTDEALLEGFLSSRDPVAFEALVRRHGPMVLGVSRRILGNAHDAEDAFQATFLVLVLKAGSIRPRAMVGNWLYGVACRTALDARRRASRRRAKEAAVLPRTQPPDAEGTDLQAVLDKELQGLPAKCRAVVVLSDLEGKTRKEVARLLGWPEGTVASRLARGRARLAKRLARYGLAVSAASLGTLLSESAASASVPTPLVVSTVKAASLLAAGQAGAGLIPAQVAALVQGALKAMLLNHLLKSAGLLLVVVAVATGTGLVISHVNGTENPVGAAPTVARTPASPSKDTAAVAADNGAAKEDVLKKELDKLKGVWACVGYEKDGVEHVGAEAREALWNERLWFQVNTPAGYWVNINWERKVGQTATAAGWRSTATAAGWKLDPTTNPKGIDLAWQGRAAPEYLPKGIDPYWEDGAAADKNRGQTQPGLYAVDGDKLRLCWGEVGKERPASLTTKKGDAWTVHLYEKKKE